MEHRKRYFFLIQLFIIYLMVI